MTNRSRTLIKGQAIPTETQDLNAPKVKRLSTEQYQEAIANDEAEKRGGWYDENKDYFSEKGKAE